MRSHKSTETVHSQLPLEQLVERLSAVRTRTQTMELVQNCRNPSLLSDKRVDRLNRKQMQLIYILRIFCIGV